MVDSLGHKNYILKGLTEKHILVVEISMVKARSIYSTTTPYKEIVQSSISYFQPLISPPILGIFTWGLNGR